MNYKKLFIGGLCVAAVFAACTKETSIEPSFEGNNSAISLGEGMIISGSNGSFGVATKAEYVADAETASGLGSNVLWGEEEKLGAALYDIVTELNEDGSVKSRSTAANYMSNTWFKKITPGVVGTADFETTANLMAGAYVLYYPYDPEWTVIKNQIPVSVPAEQTMDITEGNEIAHISDNIFSYTTYKAVPGGEQLGEFSMKPLTNVLAIRIGVDKPELMVLEKPVTIKKVIIESKDVFYTDGYIAKPTALKVSDYAKETLPAATYANKADAAASRIILDITGEADGYKIEELSEMPSKDNRTKPFYVSVLPWNEIANARDLTVKILATKEGEEEELVYAGYLSAAGVESFNSNAMAEGKIQNMTIWLDDLTDTEDIFTEDQFKSKWNDLNKEGKGGKMNVKCAVDLPDFDLDCVADIEIESEAGLSVGNVTVEKGASLEVSSEGFTVNGDVNVKEDGTLIAGDTAVEGNVTVDGNFTAEDLTVGGDLAVNKGSNMEAGDTAVEGNVTVDGNFTAGDLTVGGNVTVNGNFTAGDLTVGGDLAVKDGSVMEAGDTAVEGNVTVEKNGKMTAAGLTVAGDVTVERSAYLSVGETTIEGDVTVDGTFELNGDVTVEGNLYFDASVKVVCNEGGSLAVTGKTTVVGKIDASVKITEIGEVEILRTGDLTIDGENLENGGNLGKVFNDEGTLTLKSVNITDVIDNTGKITIADPKVIVTKNGVINNNGTLTTSATNVLTNYGVINQNTAASIYVNNESDATKGEGKVNINNNVTFYGNNNSEVNVVPEKAITLTLGASTTATYAGDGVINAEGSDAGVVTVKAATSLEAFKGMVVANKNTKITDNVKQVFGTANHNGKVAFVVYKNDDLSSANFTNINQSGDVKVSVLRIKATDFVCGYTNRVIELYDGAKVIVTGTKAERYANTYVKGNATIVLNNSTFEFSTTNAFGQVDAGKKLTFTGTGSVTGKVKVKTNNQIAFSSTVTDNLTQELY